MESHGPPPRDAQDKPCIKGVFNSGHQKDTDDEKLCSTATTLFIRCARMRNRGDLVNGFLFTHRDALGLSDWYELRESVSGNETVVGLRTDAPIECIYVKNSRKPYFLLEFSIGDGTAAALVERLKLLSNTLYEDAPVVVEVAKGDVTVANERRKLIKRDAMKRRRDTSTVSPPFTEASFVPRAVQRGFDRLD
ncbi:hypothetical protein ERJ75_000761900 [Trypanosoma vivax]|uniref:Uncharacterized protein n=1 Tax=Trypanosoma vivax (strain Y486) TaxID=1055687 RepID=G0TV83_TRYVY|nr:hypothetical protein TRVL_02619 [Trypanosoma vivax]KAH8614178.1 hypothetical protein ERJ75_000761900 [Trypanosoma vivax]CCC47849.1 conserved hypothetical protein [Trypanosoma vivax Y486]